MLLLLITFNLNASVKCHKDFNDVLFLTDCNNIKHYHYNNSDGFFWQYFDLLDHVPSGSSLHSLAFAGKT